VQLDTSSILIIFLLGFIAYAAYSAYSLKSKIWCSFRRVDRTKIEKFAKVTQKRIVFDGGYYIVRPERTTLILWTKGIHQFFPIWVRSLDFRHDSSLPLSPNDFTNTWETPEARKALNKEEDIQGFALGTRAALTGKTKKSLLESLTPLIMLGGFAILAWMAWQSQKRIDTIGQMMNVLQQLILTK